ncbi:MAG: S8 family peptidase [Roseiflexaceae bacterium]
MRRQFLFVLMIVFSLLPTPAQATSTRAPIVMTNRYAANESVRIIVTLRNDYSPGYSALSAPQLASRHATVTRQVHSFRDRNRALFATVHREFNVFPILAVTVMGRDIERIAGLPEVARIEEDQARPAALDESGEVIHSRAVVEGGYAGAGSTVVVFDTGVKSDHPFLHGRVIAEACFSTNNPNLQITSLCPRGTTFETGPGAAAPCATLCDHGTHVAGIIAGQRMCLDCDTDNQMQMSGVAPDANIIAVQVFSLYNNDRTCRNAGQGGAPCVLSWDSDIQAAMQWVFNNRNAASWGRVAAINMSLGAGQFFRACDAQNATYATWISQLRSVEIASVIASGNASFTNAVASPACIQSAVTVVQP